MTKINVAHLRMKYSKWVQVALENILRGEGTSSLCVGHRVWQKGSVTQDYINSFPCATSHQYMAKLNFRERKNEDYSNYPNYKLLACGCHYLSRYQCRLPKFYFRVTYETDQPRMSSLKLKSKKATENMGLSHMCTP